MKIRPTMKTRPTSGRLVAAAGAVITGAAALTALNAHAADAAGFPTATVHADGGLIGHVTPSTHGTRNHTFADGARVSVDCRVHGTSVGGNRTWYLIAGEGEANWVSGRYLSVHGHSEQCGGTEGTDAVATRATGVFAGPTGADIKESTLAKGDHVGVICYTGTEAGPEPVWMLTDKAHWVRGAALKQVAHIPYCSQNG